MRLNEKEWKADGKRREEKGKMVGVRGRGRI